MDLTSFWELYNSLVTAILPPLVERDGEKEENIVAAETRLGIKLPGLLRQFYLKTAHRTDINNAREELVGVDGLYFQDDHLVFYEENQCVGFWGISRNDLGEEDPIVLGGIFTSEHTENADWSDWSEEGALPLSEFLLSMLIHQIDALSSGVRRHCTCGRNSITYPSEWNQYVGHFDDRPEVYWNSRSIILLSRAGKSVEIAGIGRTEADIVEMARTFGIEWTSD